MLRFRRPIGDRRKKSFSPRVVLSGVWGCRAGIAWRVSSAGKPIWSTDLGSANGPALGMGRCWEMAGRAVSSGVGTACDCAGLLASSRPQFIAAAEVATREPNAQAFSPFGGHSERAGAHQPGSGGGLQARHARYRNHTGFAWQPQRVPNLAQCIRKSADQRIIVKRRGRDAQPLGAPRHGWIVNRLDIDRKPLQ